MHRTYVRRRLAILLVAVATLISLGGPVARAFGVASDPPKLVVSRTYVVRSGDTLWSIAATIASHRDPRRVIAELEQLNPGSVDQLTPGQALSIPPSG